MNAAPLRAASPDIAQLRKQLAAAEEADDKPAVIELSRRLVAAAPNDVALWEKLALTQIEAKEFDGCAKTLDAWQKATKQPPASIEGYRGDVAFEKKDYANAEKHWLAFVTRNPSRSDAANTYDKLAELCVDQERWIDNEKYCSKAIAAEQSATRRVWHATSLLRLHHWDAAYAEMAAANKIDSTDQQVKEWLPQFERLERLLPKIKTLDAAIAKSPNDAELLLDRARLFTLAERPLLALDDCKRAMKLQPASMRARIQTGEALLDEKREEDAAKLQIASKLLRESDKHVSESALRELGKNDALLLQNPKNAGALVARARTLRELGQYPLALTDARAALALDDKSAPAHFEIARNLFELKEFKEALTQLQVATELDPTDALKWYWRGLTEAERADFTAAIESHTRSLKLRETTQALRAREQCERRVGKIDNAELDLKRFRELQSTTP